MNRSAAGGESGIAELIVYILDIHSVIQVYSLSIEYWITNIFNA